MIHVGVDPGLSGAIASLDDYGVEDPEQNEVLSLVKMADSPTEIYRLLCHATGYQPFTICLEKVQANVRRDEKGKAITQGVSSSWKFAKNAGHLEMACHVLTDDADDGSKLIHVSPQTWQKALGLTFTKEERAGKTSNEIYTLKKNRNKAMAAELFPGVKVTHWCADALLLAEYARRLHTDTIKAT